VGEIDIPRVLHQASAFSSRVDFHCETFKDAEIGGRGSGTRDRLGSTADPEEVGGDFGSGGNHVMKGLAWEKKDVLAVWAGEIAEGLNRDARLVSVLDPEVGEVTFRDRVQLDDHSVFRKSLEGSRHGRR